MNLLFFQVRLFTVRVRLKLRASVALSPVFSASPKKKNRQTAVFLFCPRKSKGAVVNDAPVVRQSRDDRAGVEPARINSRIKPPNGGFSFLPEGIEGSGSE